MRDLSKKTRWDPAGAREPHWLCGQAAPPGWATLSTLVPGSASARSYKTRQDCDSRSFLLAKKEDHLLVMSR